MGIPLSPFGLSGLGQGTELTSLARTAGGLDTVGLWFTLRNADSNDSLFPL